MMMRNSYHHRVCHTSRSVQFFFHRITLIQYQCTLLSTASAVASADSDITDNASNHIQPSVTTTSSSISFSSSKTTTASTTTTTTAADHGTNFMIKKRPRLEALRQSLQQPNVPHLQVFAAQPSPDKVTRTVSPNVVVMNHKVKSSSSSSTKATNTTVTTSSSDISPLQIDRIRDMLLQIPDPTTNSTNILQDKHNRFHNYLRISVSERCNLRCTYCMPEQGIPLQPKHQLLTKTEIVHLASIFTQHGVNKFRITGGEPTLRHDLLDIISELKQLSIMPRMRLSNDPHEHLQQPSQLEMSSHHPSIGMTTNGITLYQNIHDYHAAGLNGVNISLDTLDEHKFSQLTRRPSTYFHNVMKSIESAIKITTTIDPNFVVKINCVIMRHMNDNEIIDFIKLTELYPTVQVRFIEYMPFQENGWNDDKFIPYQEIISNINQSSHLTNVELVPIPSNDPSDTTKWYTNAAAATATTGNSNSSSRIGFITSMSQHFCNSCNRLRLTADGQIKVCLFDGSSDSSSNNSIGTNNSTMSLRDAIRHNFTRNEIEKLIYLSVQKKHAILGGHTDPTHIMLDSNNNRPMTLIGG